MISSDRGSQSLLFFLHSSKLECLFPTRLEQGVLGGSVRGEDMTRSSPSCRHPCCPPKLGRLCHQPNDHDGSAGVRLLVLFHVTFIPYQNLLLHGDLRFFFLGLLAFIVGGSHSSLNLRRFPDRNRSKRKH